MKLVRAVLIALLLPLSVFAQSADQEVVSVVDSPDPVTPGATLSYVVTIRNNGPDPATNGGLNINLPLAVTHTTDSVPAGWTCFWLGSNGSCNTPSFTVGTQVLTINVTVGSHLAAFPDQTITAAFFTSGTTPDPNNGNNSQSANTLVDSPQVDVTVAATDSPDPVFPDGQVTYNVTVTNDGPDTASALNFNVVPNSSLQFVSSNTPAGWNCTFPAVGAVNATFNCNRATWASGSSSNFVIVFAANDEQFGINDTTFQTNFSVGASASQETDNSDNSTTLTTSYVTPDADVSITVADSPDPVAPDGNITYTVTVANNGPDTAPNVTLNAFGGNNLRFVSASLPAGWNCTLPAPNAQTPGWNCTFPAGLANGASSVLTFVLNAASDLNGIADGTILFGYSASSSVSDPVPGNNSETESTTYSSADADLNITATDSPDPVSPDGDITYTVTVTNQGPDTAPNAKMTLVGNGGQTRFVSITTPAGWSCSMPAAGTLINATNYECTNPSFANGAISVFTVVTEASDDLHPNSDHNITQNFMAGSSVVDPDATDNTAATSTLYVVPDADMNITATDSPDPVSPDGDITYTVTVTNQGPDTATNAKMTLVGNGGQTRFLSITTPAGWSCAMPASGTLINATNYECTNPSFANGATAIFTVVVDASDDLHPNSDHNITQNFTTSANEADADQPDNAVTVTTLYDVPNANLSATNADSPDPSTQGGTITYTQTLANLGPDTATNVTFNQSTPAGTTFQSFSAPGGWSCTTPAVGGSGAINCSLASMLNGANANFTLVVNVTGTGTITSTVTGSSDTNDPVPANNVATATTNVPAPITADMSITKTTTATSAPIGSTFSYTIVVTNNGPDTATSVVMTDTLPSSLLFRSITQPSPFTCTTPAVGTNGTITCNAASLANGASRTFTLVVEVAPGATGTISNGASITSAANDGNSGNSSVTATGVTAAPASADISIVKSTNSSQAVTGTNITYTILVSNAGPSPATNVIVTDDLAAGLTFVSATPSQGTCNASDPVSCNLGTIPSGANATISLVATVTASSGTVANTASVTSTEGGGDSSTTPAIPVVITAEFDAVPTLSEWALIALALAIAALAVKARL